MTQRAFTSMMSLTAAALAALAGGCGDHSSDADKAIRAQALEMRALTADSPEPSMVSVQEKVLKKVNSDLTPFGSTTISSEKSAAALLMAQANIGLGEQAAANAAAADRDAGALVAQADYFLTQWRMRQATKSAAEALDISKETAEIAKSKQEKDAGAAQERQNRAAVQTQLDALKAKIREKSDAVAQREAQYGQLMEQASRMSATQGVSTVEQASKVKRDADEFRMAGSKLEAQANTLEPQVRELDAIVSQWENQKKDLEATEASLAKSLADAREQAKLSGDAANDAASKLAAVLAELAKAREQADSAYTSSADLYTKAVRSARDSSKDAMVAGKALLGSANVSLAGLQWQRAQSLRSYASLYESLAGVKPALPDQASLADKGKAARDGAKAALDAAVEAFAQAKSAFETVRVTGPAKERLDELGKLLETAGNVSKDEGTSVSPELAALAGLNAPTPTPAAGATPAAATQGQGGDAKAALTAFLAANKAGDQSAALALTDVPDSARAVFVPMATAMTRMDKAFRAKFGKSFSEALTSSGGPMAAMAAGMNMGGASMDALKNLSGDDFTVKVDGDNAVATAAASPSPVNLKRVNGKWLVSFPELTAQLNGPQMAMASQMSGPLTKGLNDFAASIESGKYPDANAALADFQKAMMAAMTGGAMVPPGGGG